MTDRSDSKRVGKKKKLRLLLMIGGSLFFLVGVIILFLPRIISSSVSESIISSIASDNVGTPIETGDISWRWHQPLRVTNFQFGESGSIVSIDTIEVPLTFWQIATLKYQELNTITIDGMNANVTRYQDGTFNFQEVINQLPKSSEPSTSEPSSPSPLPIRSVSFELNNTTITYDDQALHSIAVLELTNNRIDWPDIQQPLTLDLAGELTSSGEKLPWDVRGKIEHIIDAEGFINLEKLTWTISSDGMNGPHQLTESGFFLSGNMSEPAGVLRILLDEKELIDLAVSWIDPALFGSPSGIIDLQAQVESIPDSENFKLTSSLKIDQQTIKDKRLGTETIELEPISFNAELLASRDGKLINAIDVQLLSQFATLSYQNAEGNIEQPFSFLPDSLDLEIKIEPVMELAKLVAPDLPAKVTGSSFALQMNRVDSFAYQFQAAIDSLGVSLPNSALELPRFYGALGLNGEINYQTDSVQVTGLNIDSPLFKAESQQIDFNLESKQYDGDLLVYNISDELAQLANATVPMELCFLHDILLDAKFTGNDQATVVDYFISIPELMLPNDIPFSSTLITGTSNLDLGVAISTENILQISNDAVNLYAEASTGKSIVAFAEYELDPNSYLEIFAPDLLLYLEPITGSADILNVEDTWSIAQHLESAMTAPDYLIENDALALDHFTDVTLGENIVFSTDLSVSLSDILELAADVSNADQNSSLDFVANGTIFQELQFSVAEPLPALVQTDSVLFDSMNTFQLNIAEPFLNNYQGQHHLSIGNSAVQTEAQFAFVDSVDLNSSLQFQTLNLPVPEDIDFSFDLNSKGWNLNEQYFISDLTSSGNAIINSDHVKAKDIALSLEMTDSPWLESLSLILKDLNAGQEKVSFNDLNISLDQNPILTASANYQIAEKSFSSNHQLTLPLDSLLPEMMNQFMPDAPFMVAVDAINSKGSIEGTIGENANETLSSLAGNIDFVVDAPAFANEMAQVSSEKINFNFRANRGNFDSTLSSQFSVFQGSQELSASLNQSIGYSGSSLGGQTSLIFDDEANSLLTFDFNYENPEALFSSEILYDKIPNSALLELEIDLGTISSFSDALTADGAFSAGLFIDNNDQFIRINSSQSSDNFSFEMANLAEANSAVLDSTVSFRINKRNDQIQRNALFSLLFPKFDVTMPTLRTTIEELGVKGNLKAGELALQLEASDFLDGSIGTDAKLMMQNNRPILTGFLQGNKINPLAIYETGGSNKNTVSFVGNYSAPILPDQQALLERLSANIEFFDITPASLRALVRFFGSSQSSIQTTSTLAALRLGTPQSAVTKIGYGLLTMSSTLLFQGGIPFNLSIFENQPIGSLTSLYLTEETNTLLGLSEKSIRLFFSTSGTEFTNNLASFTSDGNDNE